MGVQQEGLVWAVYSDSLIDSNRGGGWGRRGCTFVAVTSSVVLLSVSAVVNGGGCGGSSSSVDA